MKITFLIGDPLSSLLPIYATYLRYLPIYCILNYVTYLLELENRYHLVAD